MKTVKFKELPEKVRGFMKRVLENEYKWRENDDIVIELLHRATEWPKATDEERLAYAEWRYPKGTKITCLRGYGTSFVNGEKQMDISNITGRIWISCDVLGGDLCCYSDGKWAEIISEPDKEEQPEFKAGDDCFYCYHKYNIVAVKKGKAWIANESSEFIVDLSDLDKPDPDKHLREIAKEIRKKHFFLDVFTEKIERMLIEALKKGKEL